MGCLWKHSVRQLCLCYLVSEYCCSVWARSSYTSLIVTELHNSMRVHSHVFRNSLIWLIVRCGEMLHRLTVDIIDGIRVSFGVRIGTRFCINCILHADILSAHPHFTAIIECKNVKPGIIYAEPTICYFKCPNPMLYRVLTGKLTLSTVKKSPHCN